MRSSSTRSRPSRREKESRSTKSRWSSNKLKSRQFTTTLLEDREEVLPTYCLTGTWTHIERTRMNELQGLSLKRPRTRGLRPTLRGLRVNHLLLELQGKLKEDLLWTWCLGVTGKWRGSRGRKKSGSNSFRRASKTRTGGRESVRPRRKKKISN